MCDSDIPFFSGGKHFKFHPRFENYPLAWGMPIHECVGQVVKSTSERFGIDDWVVAIPESDQGLAEFFLAQASKAVRLPESVKNKADCCLFQPLSTVIKAVDCLGYHHRCVDHRRFMGDQIARHLPFANVKSTHQERFTTSSYELDGS